MTRNYDWESFKGYGPPTFTRIPNQLLDDHLAFLCGSELKVLLYVARRTDGWDKPADAISLNQMHHGIVRKDGSQTDHGVGLSKTTLMAAIKSLLEKRLIIRVRDANYKRTHEADVYALHKAPEEAVPETDTAPAEPPEAVPETDTELCQELEQGAVSKTGPTKESKTKRKLQQNTTPPIIPPTLELEPAPLPEPWPSKVVVDGVFHAWASSLPEGAKRTLTEAREQAIRAGLKRLAKRQPQADAVQDAQDAVQGWRWDDWKGRRHNNDIEDCLRDSNWERFRDWHRGINRPTEDTEPLAVIETNGHQANGYRPSKSQALSQFYLDRASERERQ